MDEGCGCLIVVVILALVIYAGWNYLPDWSQKQLVPAAATVPASTPHGPAVAAGAGVGSVMPEGRVSLAAWLVALATIPFIIVGMVTIAGWIRRQFVREHGETAVLSGSPTHYGVWDVDGSLVILAEADRAARKRLPRKSSLVCLVQAPTLEVARKTAAEQLGTDKPTPFRSASPAKPEQIPDL